MSLPKGQRARPAGGLLLALGLVAAVVALGAYPLARRIPRRLERLQLRVEALGAGDLATRVEVEGEPLVVRGDPRLLRRLIRNLLVNARRHAEGAPVEASLRPLTGGGAQLTVADRGPGVPEAERERIFEPFYRPPGRRVSGEGAGLGLALVRQIARRHGGDARCLPREGGGTRFEVDLRGVHPPAGPLRPERSPKRERGRGSQTAMARSRRPDALPKARSAAIGSRRPDACIRITQRLAVHPFQALSLSEI
jgi:hypothetical protein